MIFQPLSELEHQAERFAAACHQGQTRGLGVPYITHPARVAEIPRNTFHNAPDEVLAAGCLHDVVEDCAVTIQEIIDRFGTGVASMVHDLTKPQASSKQAQIAIYRDMLAKADATTQTIKVADIYDNVRGVHLNWPKDRALAYLEEKLGDLHVLGQADAGLRTGVYQIIHEIRRDFVL